MSLASALGPSLKSQTMRVVDKRCSYHSVMAGLSQISMLYGQRWGLKRSMTNASLSPALSAPLSYCISLSLSLLTIFNSPFEGRFYVCKTLVFNRKHPIIVFGIQVTRPQKQNINHGWSDVETIVFHISQWNINIRRAIIDIVYIEFIELSQLRQSMRIMIIPVIDHVSTVILLSTRSDSPVQYQ